MKITTILLYLLVIFLILWLLGALITTIYSVFFNSKVPREEKKQKQYWLVGFVVFGVLSMWAWPQILPQMYAQRKFDLDLKTGKRPKWLVRDDDESNSKDWTLSDGTEFEAGVAEDDAAEDCCITADYVNRRKPGDIECRVRMIAPSEQPYSDWMVAVPYKPKHEYEPDSEDEEDDWSEMRYAFYRRLERGKYRVEFRVETKAGVFETCSHLTMIVRGPDDLW
jgi:hypothetical protein